MTHSTKGKPPRQPRRRGRWKYLAYHEAGHAIVAHHLFGEVKRVMIDETGNGQCEYAIAVTSPCQHEGLIVALAGPMAEAKGGHVSFTYALLFRAPDGDWAAAKHRAQEHLDSLAEIGLPGDQWPQTVGEAIESHKRTASWHVRMNWPAVEAVAHALLEHGTLTGRDVAKIYDDTIEQYEYEPQTAG